MSLTIVGIDCATYPRKTGLAVAAVDGSKTILQAVTTGRHSPPAEIVHSWIKDRRKVLLAMDAPLGWPTSLGRALVELQAGGELQVVADELFRRQTDRFVADTLGKQPLEVGADRIARTAHAAAHHASHMTEYILMAITVVIVFAGIFVSYTMYMKKRALPEQLAEKFPVLYKLLFNKWYVDELYEWNVINPLHAFSRFLWNVADVKIIDGLVNGTAKFVMACGSRLRQIQTGYVQRYAITFVAGTVAVIIYYIFSLYL